MQRIAFQLRIKAGMADEYDEIHRHVWPELLAELMSFGVTNYSIFRRGRQLFLYMHVPDYDQVTKRLAASEVNRRWQQRMAPLFEAVLDVQPGEALAMMHEVFFMPGIASDRERPLSEEKQAK
jgi:L-rhamnose mutarotase